MRGSEPSAGIRTQSYAAEVGDGLRRSVAGPGRRWLLVLTLLLGGLCAALIAAFAPAPSIAVLAAPVQLVMSVPVPLSGVLLVHDQRRQSDVLRPSPVVVAAVVYATGVALVGFASACWPSRSRLLLGWALLVRC